MPKPIRNGISADFLKKKGYKWCLEESKRLWLQYRFFSWIEKMNLGKIF